LKKRLKNIKKCTHKSVGVILEENGKFLLIDRKRFPFCWASVAGHIEKGEGSNFAASREIKEEIGLITVSLRPLLIKKDLIIPVGEVENFTIGLFIKLMQLARYARINKKLKESDGLLQKGLEN